MSKEQYSSEMSENLQKIIHLEKKINEKNLEFEKLAMELNNISKIKNDY